MTPLDELLEIERRLWRNDADIYAATYLPEAVLIFPGIGRIDVDTAVEAIRGENAAGRHWAEVSFSAETAVEVAAGTCLVAYHADARWNDQPTAEAVDCLTVYVKREGRWRVAAHQQTGNPCPRLAGIWRRWFIP
ncbi:DUF4440 domain-containing protein [Sinorhizobium meliloti]|nr:DUF4440 domain-containing protein [Sinorhizobium meliloti]MDX0260982.1 DUF4440 domain-containing protein [Sinorhizobium meliloti]MDX0352036.1 DUF4440 domain-containing protein [Sinorhizobium meliloti]